MDKGRIRQMQLQDEEIIKVLLDYVKDERYKQAILIDGEWGSGKTYFVKEKLFKALKEQMAGRSVLYISLYGIDSVNQILDEIYSETIGEFIEKKAGKANGEKVEKGINILSKLFATGIKYFNFEATDLPTLADIKEIKDSIIIFDDLERCEIEVNQTLGFINNLVEHNNIKVILVANENEIGKMNVPKDLPQKYLVALNENVNVDGISTSKNDDKGKESFTKEQLIQRTDKLFAEDLLYDKVKEKLIGLTIYYHSDINSIFASIVEKYIYDGDAKDYLLKNKQIIVNLFEEKSHYNIRTLIFALMAFERFYQVLKSLEFKETKYKEEQITRILKYIFVLSIQIKSGKPTYSWKNNSSEVGTIYFGKYLLGESIYGYKFVDEYLLDRLFDEEKIKGTITALMEEKRDSDKRNDKQKNLSIHRLYAWWELEDEEIEEILVKLKQELGEKCYQPVDFKEIIIRLMQMKNNGFDEIEYTEYVSLMHSVLIDWKEPIDKRRIEVLSDDKDFVNSYKEIMKMIFDTLDNKERSEKQEDNVFLEERKYWNQEFVLRCRENRETYLLDQRFLFYVNPNKLIDEIEGAKTIEICNLTTGIKNIYNFSNLYDYFKSDVENIKFILQSVKEQSAGCTKKTKKIALDKLAEVLQEALDNIELQ